MVDTQRVREYLLGLQGRRPESPDNKSLLPLESLGVQSMSIGYLVDDDQAMIWRGPMAHGAFKQLAEQTNRATALYKRLGLEQERDDRVAFSLGKLVAAGRRLPGTTSAAFTSAIVTSCERVATKSVTEPHGTGTRSEMPSSLPASSGGGSNTMLQLSAGPW